MCKSRFIWSLLLVLGQIALFAQQPKEHCAAQSLEAEQLARHPERKSAVAALEAFTQNYYLSNQAQDRQLATVSVVVHILWSDSSENLSNAIIESQIEALNRDFQKRNNNRLNIPDDFAILAASTGLEFCLASVDPQGQASDGIVRKQSFIDCIGNVSEVRVNGQPRLHYSSLGGSDAWDPEHYLNIWVAPTCGAFLGIGTFPETVPPAEDGVVVAPLYFGVRSADSPSYPFHLGKTTTHEVGHYFNLRHIWGERGCEVDDMVEDTPQQEEDYRDCPIHPISSCGNPDMFMNFMNYVDDDCLMMFTKGQKARMWASLNGPRQSLLESTACSPPTPIRTSPLTIYPNPTRDCIHLLFETDPLESYNLYLIDAQGRRVFQGTIQGETPQSIDVQHLASGLYWVQVVREKIVYSGKVLVLSNSL